MRFVVAFLVLHVCLYGGTTAFNSHYDRDEGPVGGLANPPPPGPWLLPGSLVLQGFGLVVAAWVGLPFFAVCAGFVVRLVESERRATQSAAATRLALAKSNIALADSAYAGNESGRMRAALAEVPSGLRDTTSFT